MPYAYRKCERLKKNIDFTAAMKGKRLSIDGLSLFYTINSSTENFRVGISVGKKLAKAAQRNRLRRRIRNCIMKALQDHARGYDIVFVAKKELLCADYRRICDVVNKLLIRTVLHGKNGEGR